MLVSSAQPRRYGMAPTAKPPETEDDDFTPEEKATLRELLASSGGKPAKATPPAPGSGSKEGTDARAASEMGVSLREMERIAREQTLAVLSQLRTEEENEARDTRIAELEAALEASKKVERPPNVISQLFRTLWGAPPERDEAAEAAAAAAAKR
jgi:hypothetical protein